ncbi:CBS domain-containing protein [Gordonia sp. SID5947]|uniref:HPP family protein n=1 Tax=Gordonia sp. SID5947 TaxID=2690315 RepID=UPI0013721BCC|nr:HPP family protein [Gordonia sp. SID5947]MYR08692.1 CBS domain-containing protein [Gordonia sp. SID5947]
MTDSTSGRFRDAVRSLGPAHVSGPPREALRAGAGSAVGLAVLGMVLVSSEVDLQSGLYLIAPFGATAVLIFAAPSSPLAQPWPAVVGNTLSALIGVAVTMLVPIALPRVALAVGLAVAAMILARAVHPPAGAVAMTAALSPDAIHALGFRFAVTPVAVGTAVLVLVAMVYARATGRHYPLRRFDPEPPPAERLGLSEDELTGILARYRQSLNLGVADLARLIGAAELQATAHRVGPADAGDVMSRDLVTVAPETSLADVAELFRVHGFTSLPVVRHSGEFAGVVFQLHLAVRLREPAAGRVAERFFGRLANRRPAACAADVMSTDLPVASVDTPVAAMLPMLSDGPSAAVPVVDGAHIVGIVTQTDLIAALARQTLNA